MKDVARQSMKEITRHRPTCNPYSSGGPRAERAQAWRYPTSGQELVHDSNTPLAETNPDTDVLVAGSGRGTTAPPP